MNLQPKEVILAATKHFGCVLGFKVKWLNDGGMKILTSDLILKIIGS